MNKSYQQAETAKRVSESLALATSEQKNEALQKIAHAIQANEEQILTANEKDVQEAKANGVSAYLQDRLRLTSERLQSMSQGILKLIDLPDPIAVTPEVWVREDGLKIENRRAPLGVVAMIYEARPNVTVDAAGLCLKSGNAVLLRGSSSASQSNESLVAAMRAGLRESIIPEEVIQLISAEKRETVQELGRMNGLVDVMIPRGGPGLIQSVLQNSTVPVLETGVGNCHLYVENTAKKEMAIPIAVDAKTDRPSVCNAIETILLEEMWAEKYGNELLTSLINEGVEIKGDEKTQKLHADVTSATDEDWEAEYLAPIVAIRVVPDSEAAIKHIQQYGTKHSEAIVTERKEVAVEFQNRIDAACVYHNASTRFTDGAEFGFGAEIGISTQKLHARGPLGLPALTTNKYTISGDGHKKGVKE